MRSLLYENDIFNQFALNLSIHVGYIDIRHGILTLCACGIFTHVERLRKCTCNTGWMHPAAMYSDNTCIRKLDALINLGIIIYSTSDLCRRVQCITEATEPGVRARCLNATAACAGIRRSTS